MKVAKITESLKRELKTHRAQLQASLADAVASNGELNRLLQRQQVLREEIAELEGEGDPTNAEVIAMLTAKKTELDLTTKRLGQVQIAGTPKGEALTVLLYDTQCLIQKALKPTYLDYEAEIADTMRPFFRDRGANLVLARQSDALQEFGIFVNWGFATAGVAGAQRALAVIDQTLKGELDWEFDPNAK